jgi:hypothetical protein
LGNLGDETALLLAVIFAVFETLGNLMQQKNGIKAQKVGSKTYSDVFSWQGPRLTSL